MKGTRLEGVEQSNVVLSFAERLLRASGSSECSLASQVSSRDLRISSLLALPVRLLVVLNGYFSTPVS